MIQVRDLDLWLAGRPILSGIDFSLEDGQNLIILGRSGSGKTMLIKTLMGLFHPRSGSVLIDGGDVFAQGAADTRLSFAMVFQNAALLDSFTVFQNVALPLYERGEKDVQKVMSRVEHCLQVVGLKETLHKYPSELSGGMRKRVGIARALVYDPRYIIFDEPVSGLDPITASEVLYYITRIIESRTATTITITHEVRGLDRIGDRVLFLEEGRQLFYGPLLQLLESRDGFISRFLKDAGQA
jgi:phospholipid/cholesterol/gamma-HCH transport system ATP-binding protein